MSQVQCDKYGFVLFWPPPNHGTRRLQCMAQSTLRSLVRLLVEITLALRLTGAPGFELIQQIGGGGFST
jgi:hypothetical protein